MSVYGVTRRTKRWILTGGIFAVCLVLLNLLVSTSYASNSAVINARSAHVSLFSSLSDITGTVYAATFQSSWDGTVQNVGLNVPTPMPPGPRPVVIFVHGNFSCWASTPIYLSAARSDLAYGVAQRGWLFAAPELHGERPVPLPGDPYDPASTCPQPVSPGYRPLAALPAQYDILDTLALLETRFQVDRTRVYLYSESAGGLTMLTTLAKHADIFAAALAASAPTDLPTWMGEDFTAYANAWREVGGQPADIPFEYKRRSPLTFARNLGQTPLVLMHGEQDTKVPPHHSIDLYTRIRQWNPNAPVTLLLYQGGHGGPTDPADPNFWHVNQVLDWFSQHTAITQPAAIQALYDVDAKEDGPFSLWWADVAPVMGAARWTEVALTRTLPLEVTGVVSDSGGMSLTLRTDRLAWPNTPAWAEIRPPAPTPVLTTTVVPVSHTLTLSLPAGRVQVRVWAPTPTPTPTPTPSVGAIEGRVFHDLNSNGAPDAGEPGVAGAEIRLIQGGTLLQTYTTTASGEFAFTGLAPGTYQVEEKNPPGYQDTTWGIQNVQVYAGQITHIYFGDLLTLRRTWLPIVKK